MARKRKRRRKGPPKLNSRPKEYRKWTKESMAGAMKCVMDGKTGVICINRAADQYGVPRTTLKDRLSRKVTPGANPGPVPYLTSEEDDELVTEHLLTCADIRGTRR